MGNKKIYRQNCRLPAKRAAYFPLLPGISI